MISIAKTQRNDSLLHHPLPLGEERAPSPRPFPRGSGSYFVRFVLLLAALTFIASAALAGPSLAKVNREVQPKIVKIYGAGGLSGLVTYQSGFLISADGYILTVWSHVLDVDEVTVILDDGHKFTGKLVGADPRLELALLKIDGQDLSFFNVGEAASASEGTRVLAFSNLFGVATGDEPASVQHGTVSAVTTLDARRGAYETPYQGPIYALDAMTNNPGAAGGALTDLQGHLLGILGKELRNSQNNIWLNFAIPTAEFAGSVEAIRTGKPLADRETPKTKTPDNPLSLDRLGLVLIPNVLERTPPFVDQVRDNSPAAKAGVRPDDLILLIDNQVVQSAASLRKELGQREADVDVRLTLLRDNDLVEALLKTPAEVAQ